MLRLLQFSDQNNIEFAYTMLEKQGVIPKKIYSEILRILKIRSIIKKENEKEVYDVDYIYETMKKRTSGDFPGDKQFFLQFYNISKDIDVFDFINFYTLHTGEGKYRVSNNMNIFANIFSYFKNIITEYSAKSILFLETEKFLPELPDLISRFNETKFYLSTGDDIVFRALNLAFDGYTNVEISYFSITSETHNLPQADLNISMNILYTLRNGHWFPIRELDHLWNQVIKKLKPGSIYCFLFFNELLGSNQNTFQNYILNNFHVLSINNLYLKRGYGYVNRTVNIIEMKNQKPPKNYNIEIIKWTSKEGVYEKEVNINIQKENLKEYSKWEYDYIDEIMHSPILKYNSSKIEKVKLGDIAEIRRGKSIRPASSEEDYTNVYRLNISAIENNEINIQKMTKVSIATEQLEYYSTSMAKKNDLIISCRGSLFKMAIFNESSIKAVIDANLILIRPNSEYDSRYIKLFFESEIGRSIIKSIDTNGIILSISPKSIKNIKIPKLSLKEQKALIKRYETAMQEYKNRIQEARDNFEKVRSEIEKSVFKDIL